MERHLTFEVEGVRYYQDFMPWKDALRLQAIVVKKGFVGAVRAFEGLKKPGDLLSDPEAAASLMAAVYDVITTLTEEDVCEIKGLVERVTWLDQPPVPTRLDALPSHFTDARDMPRLYALLVKSIVEQMRPLANARYMSRIPGLAKS